MDFLTKIPRRWIGTLFGIIIALMMIWFGFWKLVFILLCAALGYVLGQYLEGSHVFEEFFQRLFPSR